MYLSTALRIVGVCVGLAPPILNPGTRWN